MGRGIDASWRARFSMSHSDLVHFSSRGPDRQDRNKNLPRHARCGARPTLHSCLYHSFLSSRHWHALIRAPFDLFCACLCGVSPVKGVFTNGVECARPGWLSGTSSYARAPKCPRECFRDIALDWSLPFHTEAGIRCISAHWGVRVSLIRYPLYVTQGSRPLLRC